jgi:D-psicose/D-tagatose/L-ribulose 3-epimerase
MIERLSLCNEVLAPWDFARQCAWAAKLGYRALEVAPYTLVADPSTLTEQDGARYAAIAAEHGLVISGLHWLLVAPAGLSISSADPAVHGRTVDFMRRMIDLCAAMRAEYLVHGSPGQRDPSASQSVEDALARSTAAWVAAGEHAGRMGVTYCIEPLGRVQTRVVNTVAEAAAIVRTANLPGLRTMLDTSSAGSTETEPLADLIDRWWPSGLLTHVQVNDRNRAGAGSGGGPLRADPGRTAAAGVSRLDRGRALRLRARWSWLCGGRLWLPARAARAG